MRSQEDDELPGGLVAVPEDLTVEMPGEGLPVLVWGELGPAGWLVADPPPAPRYQIRFSKVEPGYFMTESQTVEPYPDLLASICANSVKDLAMDEDARFLAMLGPLLS
jgi:hypothetical protein